MDCRLAGWSVVYLAMLMVVLWDTNWAEAWAIQTVEKKEIQLAGTKAAY